MTEFYMGIDIGKNGAAVVINDSGRIVGKALFKKEMSEFCQMLTHVFIKNIYVEQVFGFRGMGVKQTFGIGHSAGFIDGILLAHRKTAQYVSPRTWQAFFGLKDMKEEKKERVRVLAKQYFLNETFLASDRCSIAHDGLCDAAMIALWGRMQNENS